MAITLTRVPNFDDVYGRTLVRTFDVTFDTSYPLTNGYVIAARDVGLSAFKGITVIGGNKASLGVTVGLDLGTGAGNAPTSAALRVFTPTGGATGAATPAAPSFAEGAVTIAGTATGTVPAGGTTVTSTAANGAIISVPAAGLTGSIAAGVATAGVAKEFANGANLSTITARIEFSGF